MLVESWAAVVLAVVAAFMNGEGEVFSKLTDMIWQRKMDEDSLEGGGHYPSRKKVVDGEECRKFKSELSVLEEWRCARIGFSFFAVCTGTHASL